MMTEGVPAPPRSDPMTSETTPHKYHDIKRKTTTTQRKGGENEQRKEVPIFPAINNFYACTWYPFYVVDTTVKHSSSKLMMHQLTPNVSDCTVPKPSIVHDRTQTNLTVTVPYHAATNPTQTVPNPTATNPAMTDESTDHTASKHTVLQSTVPSATNPTVPQSTVPTVPNLAAPQPTAPTVTIPTVPQPTVPTVTIPTVPQQTVPTVIEDTGVPQRPNQTYLL
jgi:hypothetical protein